MNQGLAPECDRGPNKLWDWRGELGEQDPPVPRRTVISNEPEVSSSASSRSEHPSPYDTFMQATPGYPSPYDTLMQAAPGYPSPYDTIMQAAPV
ncbi:hypothetical protein C0Q70_08463 [Pomacea canaliculata]|uniref:Uncharacterized protein n=1 Tax=Pomacea canaliculata TaxID=400727 RepID=A0A2T7PHW5_POMCA|nr:hypothetical protein C0Q70_08463 [Pomacea canaliculata]